MNVNSITATTNYSNSPSFQAKILNYGKIYRTLETAPFIRIGDNKAHRLKQLEGMKKLIDNAGDKYTNILPEITKNVQGSYIWSNKTYYKIDVTNSRFPGLKYTENLDMFTGALDHSGINERMLDKLTFEYQDKTADFAADYTNESIKKLETKFLAKISLAAGKLPSEILKMFGVKSEYWDEIAKSAAKTELKFTPESLKSAQEEFQKSYTEFLKRNEKSVAV